MKIIICIDDSGGILFNHRRVSRDRAIVEWITKHLSSKKLWMRCYSEELFQDYSNRNVSEYYLKEAGEDEYCFVEDDLSGDEDRISEIILCRWNRNYPSDVKFNLSILDENWTCELLDEIEGSSHKKITIERWERRC